ncbi:MAG: glucosidase [Verrucomicrobiota bacterium]
MPTAEHRRLSEDAKREVDWKRWGPYLSERQWGTVREDYSAEGDAWRFFPFDHAEARAYRWGEDGLMGWTDRKCRLCFSFSLWNEKDPILKERLFGLNGWEGNHGEDVKEEYFYVDATPTHSYGKAVYKYPQRAFPYDSLRLGNWERSVQDREYELWETGAFDKNRYFDIEFEQAKRSPEDITFVIRVTNRGDKEHSLHVLPTLWFRNTWVWGCDHDGCEVKARLWAHESDGLNLWHPSLGEFWAGLGDDEIEVAQPIQTLFTENETNNQRIFGAYSPSNYYKDGISRRVIAGEEEAVRPEEKAYGTKMAWWVRLSLKPGQTVSIPVRLHSVSEGNGVQGVGDFEALISERKQEADLFYQSVLRTDLTEQCQEINRQAYAGLLWTKQFYHYVVENWLEGDSEFPPPPPSHKEIRNQEWKHVFARDVLSMPDSWEYPWFAAWDLAFHMIPMAEVDPDFAKEQLLLLLREWYLHPNGQMPAYEWEFCDVNPPVHAWAVWRVYKITDQPGNRDLDFLERAFQKLMMNFTWWVNRKDEYGRNLFSGGFLGMDNIGVFDRSKGIPEGATLEQADGTAWMAFFCGTMLSMALELAQYRPPYEDIASKFFEHYVAIADAINAMGDGGLWDEEDGFYYDQLKIQGENIPMRIRSMVGLVPLLTVEIIDKSVLDKLPGFKRRMDWFIKNRFDLANHISYCDETCSQVKGRRLLAIPSQNRLKRLLERMLDPEEFMSDYGIRSLSRYHLDHPFTLNHGGEELKVSYVPGESDSWMFGGNSNWRGPIWFPMNYLIIEALERYHHYYGDEFKVELPGAVGKEANLKEVASDLKFRLRSIFERKKNGSVPASGNHPHLQNGEGWDGLHLFHEYFHGDTGEGLGASHQTGWTALITRM